MGVKSLICWTEAIDCSWSSQKV